MASKVKCNNCNIVVNELLSFVQNKIDVMNNVSLALICRQSFSEEDILEAKCLLFESVPQRRVQRKGDDKSKRNIEDIIGLLRGADPDEIPIFVARELHKLPPVSFDHVDVTRLLKDLLLMQNELKLMKENINNDNFVTKEEFKREMNKIRRKDCDSDSEMHFETEPYGNTNRGGYRMHDSFDCNSGPVGLITGLEKNVSSPKMTKQNRVGVASPSYASVSAAAPSHSSASLSVPDRLVSVAPGTKPVSERATRATEASRETMSNVLNLKGNDNATPVSRPTSLRSADETTTRNSTTDAAGSVLLQNKDDGEWIRVIKRKSSRFKGTKGTAAVDSAGKLKAADVPIPLFIYNVSKETAARDVADYVYEKTSVSIVPERVSNVNEKSYASFKFYVPRSKLSLFTNTDLWPEGIFFRRFIFFRKGKKTSALDRDTKVNEFAKH